jgi:maleate isomerase
MEGWRARIGHIYPSVGNPDKYCKYLPEGVQLFSAMLSFPSGHEPGVKDVEEAFPIMLEQVERAAKEVATAKVQCIIQLGGALSMFRGWGGDKDIVARIEKATGLPASTHGIGEVEAMKKMGIRKVLAFTPYQEAVNEGVKHYFKGAGIEVVQLTRLGGVREMAAIAPYGLFRPIKEAVFKAPPADGIIILCGALTTFGIIEALEHDTGKPVVTADSSAIWKMLDMVSVREPIKGQGKLLELC